MAGLLPVDTITTDGFENSFGLFRSNLQMNAQDKVIGVQLVSWQPDYLQINGHLSLK